MMMRMADAEVLPFQFTDLADTVAPYITELKKLATDQRDEIKERNLRDHRRRYSTALRIRRKRWFRPKTEPVPPYLNFAPLENAADDLTEAAQEYETALRWRRGIAHRRS